MKLTALLLFAGASMAMAAPPQTATVVVPVADVWSRPLAPGETPSDELRETQVLLGEEVLIHESSGPWDYIEALEQPTFRQHNRWEGYPGWILKSAVGPLTVDDKRGPVHDVVGWAELHIGAPYLWGGLTPPGPLVSGPQVPGAVVKYGIDCSGLTHWSYRMIGRTIPRDSHEQWMKAKPIKRSQLKPADLIFSAKADNPKKVTHVALYAGDGQIIEAPQTGMVVRKVSFKEKYGKPLEEVESGDKVGERLIYFGTFLH